MIDRALTKYPLLFQDNRIQRFYIGGKLMHEWRKMEPCEDSHQCEELLVTSIGAISKGQPDGYAISKTIEEEGGILLSDLIKAYPNEILGERFQTYNPNQLTMLARVGDTTVRLVLQCHPNKADANKYFNMTTGKTEAWYIARTREVDGQQPCVYAGFKPYVTKELWRELFEKQDVEAMVECLHQIRVKQGQMILIPAGMPHCVGPGCLFLEYHECNDVTIRMERSINGMMISDEEMFYGLGVNICLEMFDYTTYDEAAIAKRSIMNEQVLQQTAQVTLSSLIGPDQNESFSVQRVLISGEYIMPEFDGHRIITAVDGDVYMDSDNHHFVLIQGHAALIPAACKNLRLSGNCTLTIGIPTI